MSLVSTWLLGDVLEIGPATGQPRKGVTRGHCSLQLERLQRWGLDGMDGSVALLGLVSASAGQLRQPLEGRPRGFHTARRIPVPHPLGRYIRDKFPSSSLPGVDSA